MTNPTWPRIETKLKRLTRADLIDLLHDLYELDPGAERFLTARLLAPTPTERAKPYRTIIRRAFDPRTAPHSPELDAAEGALAEFQRAGADRAEQVDLMLFYVETGLGWSRDYGAVDASLARSLTTVYEAAVEALSDPDLADAVVAEKFKRRCVRIVDEAGSVGWGLQEGLMALYYPVDDAETSESS